MEDRLRFKSQGGAITAALRIGEPLTGLQEPDIEDAPQHLFAGFRSQGARYQKMVSDEFNR